MGVCRDGRSAAPVSRGLSRESGAAQMKTEITFMAASYRSRESRQLGERGSLPRLQCKLNHSTQISTGLNVFQPDEIVAAGRFSLDKFRDSGTMLLAAGYPR